MKQMLKRGISLLVLLAMFICLLPATAIPSSAASYVYNWGTREVEATELSASAVSWYDKYNIQLEDLLNNYSGSSNISSVPSSSLYTKLKSIMTSAHKYINSYKENNQLLAYTDCQNGGGAISSFYSGNSIGPSWNGTWNKEHTWPDSKGLGGSDENDVMMIRPTSVSENSSRGNTAYGESNGFYNPNSESNGKYDLRGDCARIALYVYVRWGNTSKMWGGSGVMQSKEVLLRWMEEDPVDTWELGRNDAVQSITGTRNVFVDYPELCFALFGTDIPEMTTPSGYASKTSYEISAVSNDETMGTVSVSNNVITVYPAPGNHLAGYSVISGEATVTENAGTYVVSASSDCTIQFNFAATKTVSVFFSGASAEPITSYAGASVTLPEVSAPDGYDFVGWTTSVMQNESTTAPVYYTQSFVPTDDTVLYALFSYSNESTDGGNGDYVKVTTSRSDWSGEYLIVYEEGGYILDGSSISNSAGNYKTVTITNNTISAEVGDPYKFTVTTYSSGYSVQGADGQYISGSSGSNTLNAGDTASENQLSLEADGNANIISDSTYLRFNASANMFRYYKSSSYSTQKPVALYVKNGATSVICYTSEIVPCDHENVSEVYSVEGTCQDEGVICYSCDDCAYCYIESAAAGDHTYGSWTTTDTCNIRTCIYCGVIQYGVCITKQPNTVYVANGQTAKVSVAASGDGLKYQWYIKNAGETKYTRSSVTSAAYSCIMNSDRKDRYLICKVTDAYGNYEWTKTVRLRMNAEITRQPSSKAVVAGDTAKFTVKAIGSGLTYQWQYKSSGSSTWKNSVASSAKTAILSVSSRISLHGNSFRCKITDSKGNVVYSNAVRLYVIGVKTQPVSKSVKVGATVKFTVEAVGKDLTYQWQVKGAGGNTWKNSAASTAGSATLKLTAKSSYDGNQYRCKITDKYGKVVYTNVVKLTLN